MNPLTVNASAHRPLVSLVRRSTKRALLGLALLVTACRPTLAAQGVVRSASSGNPPRILVDSIHAHNYLAPPADEYFYHSNYGFRRAFDYLRSKGVKVDEITTGRLDAKTLAPCQMLFINLVSANLPPFLFSEIAAIKQYIESGGALMIITEHSNCYFHAYKLMPLLEELGIKTMTETACDRPPAGLGANDGGWIAITRFVKHPVTEGLREIAFQTGGTVDDRYAVALTSEKSWGDQWHASPYADDKMGLGLYGNFRQDPGERSGPLGVVLAKQLGKGRIVICGDQNMLGDPFINYADNYRLWLNSVGWLTNDTALANATDYQKWHKPRVVAYEVHPGSAFGNPDSDGYFYLFGALGRRFWAFASDDLSGNPDLVLFAHDGYRLTPQTLTQLASLLRAGHNVVILGPDKKRPTEQAGFLVQLETKLGPATVHTEQMGVYHSWPGCGYAVVLSDDEGYSNKHFPNMETRPSATQQARITALMDLIRDAMR